MTGGIAVGPGDMTVGRPGSMVRALVETRRLAGEAGEEKKGDDRPPRRHRAHRSIILVPMSGVFAYTLRESTPSSAKGFRAASRSA